MDAKKLIGVVLVVAGVGAALWFGGVLPPLVERFVPMATPAEEAPGVATYASVDHRLAFGYPDTFELREFPLKNGDTNWTAITLADKKVLAEAEQNGASEGPPLIAIQVFDNPTNQSAKAWAETSKFSNFALAVNGAMGSSTVGGVEGVGYIYSGLYTTDTVVIAHNGKIYMFLVDWITEEDQNRKTFDSLLSSVQFI